MKKIFLHIKRVFFKISLIVLVSLGFLLTSSILVLAQDLMNQNLEVVNIGPQRQLFVDNFLEESFTGGASLRLHHPVIWEIALLCDKPWKSSFGNYNSIFKDGGFPECIIEDGKRTEGRAFLCEL